MERSFFLLLYFGATLCLSRADFCPPQLIALSGGVACNSDVFCSRQLRGYSCVKGFCCGRDCNTGPLWNGGCYPEPPLPLLPPVAVPVRAIPVTVPRPQLRPPPIIVSPPRCQHHGHCSSPLSCFSGFCRTPLPHHCPWGFTPTGSCMQGRRGVFTQIPVRASFISTPGIYGSQFGSSAFVSRPGIYGSQVGGPCDYDSQCNVGFTCVNNLCRSTSNPFCTNPEDDVEVASGFVKNCLVSACSNGFECQFNADYGGGQYLCCGHYGAPAYGVAKMFPGSTSPLVCTTANSCLFTDAPYCVYSRRYRKKVCCTTEIC